VFHGKNADEAAQIGDRKRNSGRRDAKKSERCTLERVSARTYAVFISYRHHDNKDAGRQWATWLHHSLETYDVPPELIGRRNQRGETVPASLFPVFRDEEELSADADLSMNIRRALEHSGLLVVLCSPRAVASPYVDEEIRCFKELGKSDRILAPLIDGEPNAEDEALECLPYALRYGQPQPDGTVDWTARTQPIAADARLSGKPAQGWTTAAAYENALEEDALPRRQIRERTREYEKRLELAKLKVIAGALGVPLGELTKRNQVFALAKARRRTRILLTWLLIVGVLAIGAAIAGVIAYRNQREAERQTRVATEERDRAVRASYLNIVRRGASQVAAGQLAAARQTLFQAPRDIRAWEWWYLMARCGPSPVALSRLAAFDPARAAAMKSRLDAVTSRPPPDDSNPIVRTSGTLVLRYHQYGGRGGTMWEVHRAAGNATILLEAFKTGKYGWLPSALLGEDGHVYWRTGKDDGTGRNPPIMASGEQLRPMEDYAGFLRERYIVCEVAAADGKGSLVWDFDLTTWPDQAVDVDEWSSIAPDPDNADAVLIVNGDRDAPVHTFDFTTSRLGLLASPQELWGAFSDLTPPRAPREPALLAAVAAEDRQGGPKVDSPEYRVTAERGPAGPLVLSAWRFGNLRLRDGRSGRIIGETFGPQRDPGAIAFGGAAAVIQGTELVAGGFWWDNAIVVGVIDLRNKRVLARFEKAPDLGAEYRDWVQGLVHVSPDGRQAAMEVDSRDASYFAVWDVKSGKLVYGPPKRVAKSRCRWLTRGIPAAGSWRSHSRAA
jgi:hypothetical protein